MEIPSWCGPRHLHCRITLQYEKWYKVLHLFFFLTFLCSCTEDLCVGATCWVLAVGCWQNAVLAYLLSASPHSLSVLYSLPCLHAPQYFLPCLSFCPPCHGTPPISPTARNSQSTQTNRTTTAHSNHSLILIIMLILFVVLIDFVRRDRADCAPA
jgi:hypothetical protein